MILDTLIICGNSSALKLKGQKLFTIGHVQWAKCCIGFAMHLKKESLGEGGLQMNIHNLHIMHNKLPIKHLFIQRWIFNNTNSTIGI